MVASHDAVRRHLLDVHDYHRMGESGVFQPEERLELIEGEIFSMTPVGETHAGLVDQLNHLFARACGELAIIRVQSPIRLSDYREPEQDLALLRPTPDFYKTRLARARGCIAHRSGIRYDLGA